MGGHPRPIVVLKFISRQPDFVHEKAPDDIGSTPNRASGSAVRIRRGGAAQLAHEDLDMKILTDFVDYLEIIAEWMRLKSSEHVARCRECDKLLARHRVVDRFRQVDRKRCRICMLRSRETVHL